MSDANAEDMKKHDVPDDSPNREADEVNTVEDLKDSDKTNESAMPSTEQEEEIIKKKYGGILPKKPPLISKDHERAYFDSADWALGKQGAQKPKGPLEALRPKLQPTHQQVRTRRSAYAPSGDGEGEEDTGDHNAPVEQEMDSVDGDNDKKETAQV